MSSLKDDIDKPPYIPNPAEDRLKELKGKPDPWKHRSKEMRCASCMWYVKKEAGHQQIELGRCRRHAPTMNGFPAVFPTDWCGDHKLDENKLGV